MFPILVDLGRYDLPLIGEKHLFLPAYGFLFASAVLLAWWWFTRRAKGLGFADESVFNLTFFTMLAGIFGAKLLLVIVDWRTYAAHPGEILGTIRSAGVLGGGFVLGAVVFVLYAKRKGLPVMVLGDAVVAQLALAQGVGRLGCVSAGCCWGVPASPNNPISITFTNPVAREQTGVPLHVPLVSTQLIELSFDLLLVLLLTWLWRSKLRPHGTVAWIYLLLYGVGRGIIEFWRGDTHRGLFLGGHVSTSQILAFGAALLALVMLWRSRARGSRGVAGT